MWRTTRNIGRYTECIDWKDNLWKMEDELKRIVNPRLQIMAQKIAIKKLMDLPPINIYYIGTVGFYQNLVQPNTIAFTTSLYKINKLIKEKETLAYNQLNKKENEFIDEELVDQKLPYWYWEFKNIFSKAVFNTLPPYQLYDYKIEIELDKENTFGFSPLRQQFTTKLQATKQYIINNLYKGFIKPSQALFALLILFTKKLNKRLCFCINYYKLNNMTYKD